MQEPHNPLTELLNADQKLWQHLPSSFPYILPRIVPLKKDAPSEICLCAPGGNGLLYRGHSYVSSDPHAPFVILREIDEDPRAPLVPICMASLTLRDMNVSSSHQATIIWPDNE